MGEFVPVLVLLLSSTFSLIVLLRQRFQRLLSGATHRLSEARVVFASRPVTAA